MDTREYGCLFAKIPQPQATEIINYTKEIIQPYDLISYEEEPHITVKYGIETNDVEEVAAVLGKFIPIRVMFGKTSFFEGEQCDIVEIDVFSQLLKRFNKRITEKLKCTTTHPVYIPHITLAYIEQGGGLAYLDTNPFIGQKIIINELVFTPTKGKRRIITCEGTIK